MKSHAGCYHRPCLSLPCWLLTSTLFIHRSCLSFFPLRRLRRPLDLPTTWYNRHDVRCLFCSQLETKTSSATSDTGTYPFEIAVQACTPWALGGAVPRRGGRHKAPTHAMHFAKIFSGETHWLTLGDHCRIVFVTALYQKSSSPGNSDEHGPCFRSC